ncbi:MAG: peptidoglycan-binding protein [Leptolyngbyaceae bacterium]|nr:peptidoglycan-binding protein [Leptolyngbyaceae bacterium]
MQKRTMGKSHSYQQFRAWGVAGAIAILSSLPSALLSNGAAKGATTPSTAAIPISPPQVRLALVDTALAGSDRPLLQFGEEGPQVQAIQALLQIMGYYSGPIDGRYQESTVLAIIAFQQAAGLNGDGIVGPTTWAKLLPLPQQIPSTNVVAPPSPSPSPSSPATPPTATPPTATPAPTPQPPNPPTPPADVSLPTLRLGMRGPAVTSVQERLRRLGFFQGTVDGVFGSQTEAAVKAAQRSFSLNADGIVGPATWAALLQQ